MPEKFVGPLVIGSRVRVPLHGRSVRGWIVGPNEGIETDLKEIKGSLGVGPSQEIVNLCSWAAWRWAGPWSRFLGSSSPDTIVRKLPTAPPWKQPETPQNALGALGAESFHAGRPTLVRIGPTTDPFDLIVGFLSALPQSETAIVLVPGRGYGARLVARLSRRGMAVIDAGDDWSSARAGWPVVVGTRTAALSSVEKLGAMVVLDAEDDRYYSQATPTWNAMEIARKRCEDSIPLLIVSSTPNALLTEGTTQPQLPESFERDGWPTVEVVNQLEEDPRTGILSLQFVDRARQALDQHPNGVAVACIVNRKGRARLVVCNRCDRVARCSSCDAACVLHDSLDCPRCGTSRPVICSYCGATAMKLLRLGTSQLAVECEALFHEPTVEMTTSSGSDVLHGARIVVGTEAILYRLRSTRLVVFLDLDHHLLAPQAGAEIRALTMIGRAGRLVGSRSGENAGTVLVQTRLFDHPVIEAAVHGDPSSVIASDRQVRTQLGLAPFGSVAVLKGPGAQRYAEALQEHDVKISLLSEREVLVKAVSTEVLDDALAKTARPKESVRVGVDPVSL